jgi:hypothetical protein
LSGHSTDGFLPACSSAKTCNIFHLPQSIRFSFVPVCFFRSLHLRPLGERSKAVWNRNTGRGQCAIKIARDGVPAVFRFSAQVESLGYLSIMA